MEGRGKRWEMGLSVDGENEEVGEVHSIYSRHDKSHVRC